MQLSQLPPDGVRSSVVHVPRPHGTSSSWWQHGGKWPSCEAPEAAGSQMATWAWTKHESRRGVGAASSKVQRFGEGRRGSGGQRFGRRTMVDISSRASPSCMSGTTHCVASRRNCQGFVQRSRNRLMQGAGTGRGAGGARRSSGTVDQIVRRNQQINRPHTAPVRFQFSPPATTDLARGKSSARNEGDLCPSFLRTWLGHQNRVLHWSSLQQETDQLWWPRRSTGETVTGSSHRFNPLGNIDVRFRCYANFTRQICCFEVWVARACGWVARPT